jgi:hypothetical protein
MVIAAQVRQKPRPMHRPTHALDPRSRPAVLRGALSSEVVGRRGRSQMAAKLLIALAHRIREAVVTVHSDAFSGPARGPGRSSQSQASPLSPARQRLSASCSSAGTCASWSDSLGAKGRARPDTESGPSSLPAAAMTWTADKRSCPGTRPGPPDAGGGRSRRPARPDGQAARSRSAGADAAGSRGFGFGLQRRVTRSCSCVSAARRRASACSQARWSSRMRAGLLGRCP